MPQKKKKYHQRIDLGYDSSGKRVRKWINADTLSEFNEKKRQAIIDMNERGSPSAVTLLKYAETWAETYKASRSLQTRQMYDVAVRKLKPIGNKRLQEVTQTDLQKLLNDNSDSPRACEQLRLTIRQICKQAIRDKILKDDLSDGLEIPKQPKPDMRYLSDDEIKEIMSCELEDQDKLYITVLINTGLRPSEALALQWNDIDKKKNVIHVRRAFEFENNKPRTKSTKTDVCRDVPASPQFVQMLLKHHKSSVFVFSVDGCPFTRSNYYTMYKRVFRAIEQQKKITGINFYTFRHTYATQLYYNGVKPGRISTKEAARIMGHSEHIFLTKYTHLDSSKENINEVLEALSKVVSGT